MPKVVYNSTKGLFQNSSSAARISIPASGSDAPAVAVAVAAGAATIAGTDVSGIVTIVTQLVNNSTLTITFDTAYDTAPVANITLVGLANIAITSVSTTAIVLTASGDTTTGSVHYQCFAQS